MLAIAAPAGAQDSLYAARQQAIQQAIAAVEKAVVRIETIGGVDVVDKQLTAAGPTTGTVIRSDGYIITSRFNFLSRPSSIIVTLSDGRKIAAGIVAEDHSRMLTLLKVEADGLAAVEPAPKSEIRVGQTAIALGRTFDPQFPNVSVGIISALDRVWGRAVQSDAKTSPVNYGGPLIDLSGRCLGIIVPLDPGKEGETAGVEWYDSGIGFAIPAADVVQVLDRLAGGETLKPGLFGISLADGLAVTDDPKILRVRPGSPADQAGLQVDDIIVHVAGRDVARVNDFKQAVGPKYAGDEVPIRVKRGAEELAFTVKLAAELKAYQFPYAGLLAARETEGPPKVRAVLPGGPLANSGLAPGDAIESVSDVPVANLAELREQLRRHEPGDEIALAVVAGADRKSVKVKLDGFPNSLPDPLPAAKIPNANPPDKPATGRINEQVPGGEGTFWAHIPENYHSGVSWGLLIWLHPAGDGMEAEALRAWQGFCAERGYLLVGPRAADVAGWSDDEAAGVVKIVDWMKERYRIDPARVAVIGSESSAAFAARLAFRGRDLIRGLVLLRGIFRSAPPDNAPDKLLQIVLVPESEQQETQMNEMTDALRELRYPTAQLPVSSKNDGVFAPAVMEKLAAWLDALDRL